MTHLVVCENYFAHGSKVWKQKSLLCVINSSVYFNEGQWNIDKIKIVFTLNLLTIGHHCEYQL